MNFKDCVSDQVGINITLLSIFFFFFECKNDFIGNLKHTQKLQFNQFYH